MSREKKSRRLKGKLDIKTGSKKNFIERGQKGRIPSKNKLAKHGDKQQSAYKKHLEEQGKPSSQKKADDENGKAERPPAPFSRASKAAEAERDNAVMQSAENAQEVILEAVEAAAEVAKPKKVTQATAKPKAATKPKAAPRATGKDTEKPTSTAAPKPKAAPVEQETKKEKAKPEFDSLSGDDLWNLLDD
ncbi:hypothetical protein NFC81_07315 [Salinispirillum sp. LH 10-3-1]|uniref:Uncharacterized protein n=1 Tax=Salinispirillum sp. LH 10-3-1 TaxID=2952525 RepID=A0AB38YJZ0_9GAMM